MEDLSLHILDIAENSATAGATLIELSLVEDRQNSRLKLTIKDNGRGMPAEFVKCVLDPFCTTRTTRRVGMGLSLLAQSARETGGDIQIISEEGKGTTVTVGFRTDHIDMKPVGNIPDSIITLIAGNPAVDLYFRYRVDSKAYELDTRAIRDAMEDVPINSPAVLDAIRGDIEDGIKELTDPTP